MNRTVVLGLCAATAAALCGCSSSKTNGEAVQTSAASTSVVTTPADTSPTTDVPTTAAVPTSAASSSPATGSPAPQAPKDACTFAQLGIRVLRGSGAQQQEFASVFFTNKGSAPCTMFGFPGVSLRLADRLLGQPATRENVAAQTVRLAPGGRAQADITDYSSCQAPLSDTVRVYPPNATQFVDLPLDIRGCTITVKPVAASG